jgi:hypothetical protein
MDAVLIEPIVSRRNQSLERGVHMRKFFVAMAVVAMGALAVPLAASATEGSDHVDLVEVAASCNADGTQSATWVITNTSDEHVATITDIDSTIGPLSGASEGDALAPGESVTVTLVTSGDQTGTVSIHVTLTWEDPWYQETRHDDVVFTGGCVAVPPVTVEVPGPTVEVPVLVPVPGPTVEVPGPTQTVEVPGPSTQTVVHAASPVVATGRFTG